VYKRQFLRIIIEVVKLLINNKEEIC